MSGLQIANSRFDLVTCKRYANHLAKNDRGVRNPGGFAQSIHRSGAQDDDIEAWLEAENEKEAPPKRESFAPPNPHCRQCEGTGFVMSTRKINGVETRGRLYTTYTGKEGKTQRKLIRCDHATDYADYKRGAPVRHELTVGGTVEEVAD